MRCHWSWRSPSDRPLCWIATRSPKRCRKAPASAGVRPISGTRTSAGPPGLADIARQPQIDLRLAAAGDAVKQRGSEPPPRGQAAQFLVGRGLLGGQRPALACLFPARSRQRGRVERIAVRGFAADGHQPAIAQALQHVVRHPAVAQLGDGKAGRHAGKERQRFALFGTDEFRSGGGARTGDRDLRDADLLERLRLPFQDVVHVDQTVGLERAHRGARGHGSATAARRRVFQPVRD